MAKTILVPGGAGFIGSHTLLALKAAGYTPLVLDNLSNGHQDAVLDANFIEGDIRDEALLDQLFENHAIDAVVHFAAFIEAGESVRDPMKFYDNNVAGSLNLVRAMVRHGVRKMVFSSTAAVYGDSTDAPLTEDLPKVPINPYGQTKWAVECMLRDTAAADGLQAIALRYFNAAGADPEGRLGERHDPETHLIPLVLQAASGQRDAISIFGTDYDTRDGTCIRDYIHVADLADAHVKALEHLFTQDDSKVRGRRGFYDAFNLGNGQGFSVREVVDAAKQVTGVDFTVKEEERRPGDPAVLVANAEKARTTLGWSPSIPALEDMVAHAWNFMGQS
ncbi:UDP-glucose 4-epimerase GalE [Kordiimonas lacus]|uniref:UDP-glucose 4-epimerase n=1 Tax=Kordiimonas lacus TaxID=637679 RepID=A0A1G7F853_9PROT|nr:UDP-glucose 4-epimerase GalE [Kordiimonas lacus]SDE72072.1 UDP-galactose 4-epimerase [Kordiimonas lacus]